jgi:hypothetical protein
MKKNSRLKEIGSVRYKQKENKNSVIDVYGTDSNARTTKSGRTESRLASVDATPQSQARLNSCEDDIMDPYKHP